MVLVYHFQCMLYTPLRLCEAYGSETPRADEMAGTVYGSGPSLNLPSDLSKKQPCLFINPPVALFESTPGMVLVATLTI